MLKLMRVLFGLSCVGALGIALFAAVMFAAEIWGVYCLPPDENNPRGATLIVTPRYDDEPFINAADRPVPLPDESESNHRSMFGNGPIKRMSIEERTVVKLPYFPWLHKKAKDSFALGDSSQ